MSNNPFPLNPTSTPLTTSDFGSSALSGAPVDSSLATKEPQPTNPLGTSEKTPTPGQSLDKAVYAATQTVDPKPAGERNEAEQHVGNISSGIAGALATAPLAAIEKVSPVVADKLAAAGSSLQAQASQFASNAVGTDGQPGYIQQAAAAAQAYLPQVLGGGGKATENLKEPTDANGTPVSQRAGDALSSAQTSASTTAQSAVDSVSSAAKSASATAQSYIPAALGGRPDDNKTLTGESPYVSTGDDKATSTISPDSVSGFASSNKTSAPGLIPQTTDGAGTSHTKPTQGLPGYTGSTTDSYAKDQSSTFAPAEFASDKHASAAATAGFSGLNTDPTTAHLADTLSTGSKAVNPSDPSVGNATSSSSYVTPTEPTTTKKEKEAEKKLEELTLKENELKENEKTKSEEHVTTSPGKAPSGIKAKINKLLHKDT